MRCAFLLLAMAACASPSPRDELAGGPLALVSRLGSWPMRSPGAAQAVVADTAASWRVVRETLGEAGVALPDDWCTFAIERAIVVTMPGAVGGPVAVAEHSEEGVDVLTLTPQLAPTALGLAVAFVVPARPTQLAIVVRLPDAEGDLREATLAVFAGR